MNFTEIKVPTNKFIVCVDSRARNPESHPNPHEYTVEFQKTFKNIVSVELVAAIYDGIAIERYVNVVIDELCGGELISNTNAGNGAFTQLPLTLPINQYTQDQYRSIKTFDHPLSKLSKLSIRFVGSDSLPYIHMSEQYLRFEIICCKYESTVESNSMEIASNVVHMYRPLTPTTTPDNITYVTDPHLLLGVSKDTNIQSIVLAFRQKCGALKLNGGTQWEYDRLKRAFKDLSSKCTQ